MRLRTRQLIDAANQVMGSATAVRTIRILPPGTAPAAPLVAKEPASTTPTTAPVPAQRYETPAGYREAIAVHRQARVTRPINPAHQAAVEGQIRNGLREPEHLFADGQAELARLGEQDDRERARSSSHALAVARARGEKAGLVSLSAATRARCLDLSA
ncbi:hypothetical protein ACWDX6_27775 [Streptomyces sp. NPDC003027]